MQKVDLTLVSSRWIREYCMHDKTVICQDGRDCMMLGWPVQSQYKPSVLLFKWPVYPQIRDQTGRFLSNKALSFSEDLNVLI